VSGRTLHVRFRQSSGALVGQCWCGRVYENTDPKALWAWLDGHDHDHVPAPGRERAAGSRPPC
jgi:hypothetical protein